MVKFFLARFKEPSTWAGLAAIAVSLGHPGGASLIATIGEWAIPIMGGIAAILPEATSRSASEVNY